MKLNTKTIQPVKLNEHSIPAFSAPSAEEKLKRLVNSCMLWEDTFYVDGQSIADTIRNTVPAVDATRVAQIAIDAREQLKLRHVPLLLVREMARLDSHKYVVADTLERVIQRPDELAEYLAIYWADGKQPISAQSKKGLARAFNKFSEYSFSKYDRDADIKLRDVLFLTHAKPNDESLFKRIADRTLQTPDTWEVNLSAGANKKETFTRLIQEGKLGALALLRNLRNMEQAGVDRNLVRQAIESADYSKVLPFRFIAAARYAPFLESSLEKSFISSMANSENTFAGKTVVLMDLSTSMNASLSKKSDMTRMDAGFGLAMVLRELCEDIVVYTFSTNVVAVPDRRGFALRDAMDKSQRHWDTRLAQAIKYVNENETYDRLVVISDEQATDDSLGTPLKGTKGYVLNVGSYQNGLKYGPWTKVNGFSEAVVNWMRAEEEGT
jgi:60 kDa SS-A/Ro ribonucleoprotein